MDFLFSFSAIIVLPFWAAMIFFPNRKFTEKLVGSPWIILPPTVCYILFLVPNLNVAVSGFGKPSLESMAEIMKQPWAAGMYWAYAGAFDLFVGRWIFFDARETKISHWFISPILFVCIFFGPIGFAFYALVKAVISFPKGQKNN